MALLEDRTFTHFIGRNGGDAPFSLLEGQCREAENVEFWMTGLGRKRRGAVNLSLTGGTFNTFISSLHRFSPDEDPGNAEMFAIDGDSPPNVNRLAGGATWASVTLSDAISSSQRRRVTSANLNGKLFFAFNSGVNRLHVWDPADSKIRRVGLQRPVAPTVADTGSGSYGANERFYRVAYIVQSGSDILRRSELSPSSTAFTPSGSGAAARVTKPASISEDETHWEIYGSEDESVFYLLGTEVVGTTTFDDTTDPEDYTGTAAPLIGTNLTPPSVKVVVSSEARLLMLGPWDATADDTKGETQPFANALWWTPVLGTNNIGDDERIPNISGEVENRLRFEEDLVGIGGPLLGSWYVFSQRRMWKVVPTGIVSAPFVRFPFASVGCLNHKSIVMAQDERGDPALYWLASEGPMRIDTNGLARMGFDVQDKWDTVRKNDALSAFGLFYREKNQIWWYVPTGVTSSPTERWVYQVDKGQRQSSGTVRGGWAIHTGGPSSSVRAACGAVFAETVGSSMSTDERPYIGRWEDATILKADSSTTEVGVNFEAFIRTPDFAPWGLGRTGRLPQDAYAWVEATAGTLRLDVIRDFGEETRQFTATAPGTIGTHARAKFEASGADLEIVAFRLGDNGASAATWSLDSLTVPIGSTGRDGIRD